MHNLQRHARSGRGGVREAGGLLHGHLIRRLPRAALLALCVAAGCSTEDAGPERVQRSEAWTQGAELPTARTEVAVAALGGKIYVAGGFQADGSASDVVEVYSPDTDEWSASASLPMGVHHTGLVATAGRLYLIGGYLADGAASKGVWSWAPQTGAWEPETDLPTARGALAVAVVGDRLHAVGGATGFGADRALTGAHEVYDIETRRWSELPPLPGPRDHLAAAAVGDDLFVVGGRELSLERNQRRLDIFEGSSQRWSRGPDMPTARGGLAAAAAGGRVYVFGGEQPSGTFDEAEVLDVRGREWSSADRMPTARHGVGAAIIGDRVYVVGGGRTPGLSVSGANEILDVGAADS